MSWFSRQAGRFSPFGRGSAPSSSVVSDADFSYITNEDLRRSGNQVPEVVEWDDEPPSDRETDCVVFKAKRTNYPTHFPVHSIRDGALRIGTLRQAAAKKIGVDDARRVRLFYKGRNLKHDDKAACDEGLRGDGAEILVSVGDAAVGGFAPGIDQAAGTAQSGDDDDESGGDDDESAPKKKSRKRGGRRSKKKADTSTSGASTPGYTTKGADSEFLPIPSHVNAAPRPSSAPPQPARPAAPVSPQAKLDAIASKFHTELVPLCVQYMANPPQDPSKRDFEHKKLSETVLTQIIFKLDGVETEGDQDARASRKALIKEVQGMLAKLDAAAKLEG